jgi:D-3-phosphoglycerate dehydrogenase / 2-oxoglutarate reductase
MFKVVTAAGPGSDFSHEMEALGPYGTITEIPADDDGFIAAAQDADAVYCRGTRMPARVVEALPKVKLIALGSVGVDLVDVAAATRRGVPVTNCPDVFIEEVADHAMTLLLSAHRRVLEQDRMVREHRWKEGRPALYRIPRLMGLTLGFVAFGHIPRAVARRARPFGLRMIAYDPFVDETILPEYGVVPATLDEVLSQSDFVSMHAPGTPEAAGMLTEAHFRRMKANAVFINTGRGATVEEAGLIKALQEGWIAHAALDVLETEPPGHNNPLLSMPNVTLSPHNASASARFDPARKRRVGQELALAAQGKWPMSCVNPAVLGRSELRRWQPVSMERGPNS